MCPALTKGTTLDKNSQQPKILKCIDMLIKTTHSWNANFIDEVYLVTIMYTIYKSFSGNGNNEPRLASSHS